MKKLTARQARFAEEYGIDGNATQAAFRAGYGAKCAKEQGYRLLTNVHVRAAIKKHGDKVSARLGIDKEGVVRELVNAARLAIRAGDPAGAILGWREIARLLALYPNESRTRHPNETWTPADSLSICSQLASDMRLLSDDQLILIAGSGGAHRKTIHEPVKPVSRGSVCQSKEARSLDNGPNVGDGNGQ